MKQSIALSLVGGAIFLALGATGGQAAITGMQSAAPTAAHASAVSQARWWRHGHRRCWWRHHHRYCR